MGDIKQLPTNEVKYVNPKMLERLKLAHAQFQNYRSLWEQLYCLACESVDVDPSDTSIRFNLQDGTFQKAQ